MSTEKTKGRQYKPKGSGRPQLTSPPIRRSITLLPEQLAWLQERGEISAQIRTLIERARAEG